jgi:hypothetical protein
MCSVPHLFQVFKIFFLYFYSSSQECLILSVFLISSTLTSSTFVYMKVPVLINIAESQLSGPSACQGIQV